METPTLALCNSSPIISLQRIGRVDLLDGHFRALVIPPAVAREVGCLPSIVELRPLLDSLPEVEFPATIHPGEAEVLLMGLAFPDSVLVLDDDPARRFAKLHSLDVVGTLGVLLRCKKQGRIDRLKPLIEELLATGTRLSEGRAIAGLATGRRESMSPTSATAFHPTRAA